MPAGDAQRVWFPEMIEELKRAWSPEMTWVDLAEFCARITQVRREIRRSRGIRPPLFRCPRCGEKTRSEIKGVSIRSALYVLKNNSIVTETKFKALDKSWKKHRAKQALDAYGQRSEPAAAEVRARPGIDAAFDRATRPMAASSRSRDSWLSPRLSFLPSNAYRGLDASVYSRADPKGSGCCTSASDQLPLDLRPMVALPTTTMQPPPPARAEQTAIKAGGQVGKKLIRAMRRERSKTVVDFSAIAEGARHARELQEGTTSREDLADYDPSHGWYVRAQQQLSILVEQTGAMRETLCFTDPINDAEV